MSNLELNGYLSLPTKNNGKVILVLHAWWGLNETIKAFCRRLANEGFTVLAPDLYHGKIADTISAAETLSTELDTNHLQAKADVLQAARFLEKTLEDPSHGLAVIGFSMGAYYAIDLSTSAPEITRKVVTYYGSGPSDFRKSQAEYLAHFASNDPYEPQANLDYLQSELKAANRPATFYTYPGTGHWFFESDRVGAYNREAAELAWERTIAFLNS